MGGFYASIQVRTGDRAAVKAAVKAVAAVRSIHCLIGPVLNGWVGIYVKEDDQGESIGQQIAERVGGYAIQLLVHDDGVLAYWLWSAGRIVDRYNSSPGYFGEESMAEEVLLVGDPKRFEFVLDEAGQRKLAKVIDRDVPEVFEVERLRKLGRLLGIENASTSYEYLKDGDGSPVKGRRQFVEIPADDSAAASKSARAAAAKKIHDERKRLKSAGLLLAHFADGDFAGGAHAVAGGFVRFPAPHLYEEPSSLHFHSPPWKAPAFVGFDLPPRSNPFNIRTEWSGRWVAAQADSSIRVWDWNNTTARHLADLPTSQFASVFAISADGKQIAETRQNGANSNHEIALHDIDARQVIATTGIKHIREAAFSPDGRFFVIAARVLEWIDLLNGFSRSAFAIGNVSHGQTVEASCVGFSRDSRWLWCGTNRGLFVFDFSSIRGGETSAPAPIWTAKPPTPPKPTEYLHVHSIVEEVGGRALLFAGLGPNVMRLDLGTGAVRSLLEIPGATFVTGLAMTPDGRYLGVSSTDNQVGSRTINRWFQIWDYTKLCEN